MTTDPLADALAELRRARKQWPTGAIHNVLTAKTLEPILNAVMSGDLMPRSEHLATMAAANEAAAEGIKQHSDVARKELNETYTTGDAKGNETWSAIVAHLDIAHDKLRALTTADQQAALDRVKREAREEALRPIREAVTQYHLALDRRENGNTAGYHLQDAVQRLLDMPWRQGAALAALADGEPT